MSTNLPIGVTPDTPHCIVVLQTQQVDRGWVPSVVYEGVPGHFPLTEAREFTSPWMWRPSLEQAKALAAEANAELGVTPQRATEILLSSIGAASHVAWPFVAPHAGTGATKNPHVIALPDGQLRIFEPDEDEGDLGRMYVLDVLGMSVLVHERSDGIYIHIDADPVSDPVPNSRLIYEVNNGGEHYAGE